MVKRREKAPAGAKPFKSTAPVTGSDFTQTFGSRFEGTPEEVEEDEITARGRAVYKITEPSRTQKENHHKNARLLEPEKNGRTQRQSFSSLGNSHRILSEVKLSRDGLQQRIT